MKKSIALLLGAGFAVAPFAVAHADVTNISGIGTTQAGACAAAKYNAVHSGPSGRGTVTGFGSCSCDQLYQGRWTCSVDVYYTPRN